MGTPDFRFKQFTIRHDRSAMKVGTDGVLLGAWAGSNLNHNLNSQLSTINYQLSTINCLDVGTGTGLIALMLAQRFPNAQIEGIDIDESSLEQAKENVEASPFRGRISLRKQDFNHIDYCSKTYDLIISNPPFYKEDTLSGKDARDAARHTTSLPFETLVINASKLLTDDGLFSVIIPYGEASDFISLCAIHQLYLSRRTDVRANERKPFKRTLLEFSRHLLPAEITTLTLYQLSTANCQRSTDYAVLTQNFYL